MNRFFIDDEICLDTIINIKKQDINHIKNVLRLKKGDSITVVNNKKSALSTIVNISDSEITAQITEFLMQDSESPVKVILAQALSKGDKMDFIVQKAVELGVFELAPLALERSVVNYDEKKATAKQQRWQAIAEGAAKQSKRTIIPQVLPIMTLSDMLENISFDNAIVAYEQEDKKTLKKCLKSIKPKTILLVIGPEGGFAKQEIELLQAHKALSVTLGKRILRTETAALVLTSLVMYELGDLGGYDE